MALSREKDPRTKKEMVLAEGEVSGVFFNPLKNIKSYSNPNGNADWTPTHSVNIVVDGVRVNLGLTDKDIVRAKDVDDNYQDITRGTEVSIEVKEEKWESNGKSGVNYTALTKDIVVLKVGQPAQQSNNNSQGSSGASTPYKKKDSLPIRLGNAITAASYMASKSKTKVDFSKILAKAEEIYPIVDEIRLQLEKDYPDMDDYSLGARLGQCVVIASQHYVKTVDDFGKVLPDMFKEACEFEDSVRNPPVPETPEEEEQEGQEEDFDPEDIPF